MYRSSGFVALLVEHETVVGSSRKEVEIVGCVSWVDETAVVSGAGEEKRRGLGCSFSERNVCSLLCRCDVVWSLVAAKCNFCIVVLLRSGTLCLDEKAKL
jgi:hypothetical protein